MNKKLEKQNEYTRQYYIENRERILAYQEKYRTNPGNKDKIKILNANYQKANKIKIAEQHKIWANKNKQKLRISGAEYKNKNKAKIRQIAIDYKLKNSIIIKNKNAEYNQRNREIINAKNVQRRKDNPRIKLAYLLRSRIRLSLNAKGWSKASKTQEILGASYSIVKKHIENQFTKGMSWDNHGDWHIDHKIPIASAKTKKEMIKLFHYTNLQPLWAMDNLLKGNKMPENYQMKLTL